LNARASPTPPSTRRKSNSIAVSTTPAKLWSGRPSNGSSCPARAYHRILKLALTLADLAGAERIEASHLAEAIQYRRAFN